MNVITLIKSIAILINLIFTGYTVHVSFTSKLRKDKIMYGVMAVIFLLNIIAILLGDGGNY